MLAVAVADAAEIDLEGDEDEDDDEAATDGEVLNAEDAEDAAARKREVDVPRSDVLPLLLALEEEDPSLGLGRQV